MAAFPTKESDILALGEKIVAGLRDNTDVYPAPPVTTEDLTGKLDSYLATKNAELAAQSAWEEAVSAKRTMLQAFSEAMKAELRYAENTVNFDDAKLKLLGWGGRRTKKPLQLPGQTRALDIVRQGEGAITLKWKAPTDGGGVSAYKVQRLDRFATDAPWLDVGTSVGTEITLANQERGKEFEFRVLAINKAGDGAPSNTVMASL
ncbi:MAG: fibronectin type III domain-containing protein [Gammaproteobacteria bacterium]|nr:fibronectin type III domain-containing protein [Gammaproteobacteria bacterium]